MSTDQARLALECLRDTMRSTEFDDEPGAKVTVCGLEAVFARALQSPRLSAEAAGTHEFVCGGYDHNGTRQRPCSNTDDACREGAWGFPPCVCAVCGEMYPAHAPAAQAAMENDDARSTVQPSVVGSTDDLASLCGGFGRDDASTIAAPAEAQAAGDADSFTRLICGECETEAMTWAIVGGILRVSPCSCAARPAAPADTPEQRAARAAANSPLPVSPAVEKAMAAFYRKADEVAAQSPPPAPSRTAYRTDTSSGSTVPPPAPEAPRIVGVLHTGEGVPDNWHRNFDEPVKSGSHGLALHSEAMALHAEVLRLREEADRHHKDARAWKDQALADRARAEAAEAESKRLRDYARSQEERVEELERARDSDHFLDSGYNRMLREKQIAEAESAKLRAELAALKAAPAREGQAAEQRKADVTWLCEREAACVKSMQSFGLHTDERRYWSHAAYQIGEASRALASQPLVTASERGVWTLKRRKNDEFPVWLAAPHTGAPGIGFTQDDADHLGFTGLLDGKRVVRLRVIAEDGE